MEKNEKVKEAVDLLLENEVDITTILQKDWLLKQMTKALIERALESAIQSHLGYDKYGRSEADNYRNGTNSKSLISENGVIPIEVPRDRNSDFEPQLIKKHQTRIDGLDDEILSLYAKGMSLSDIRVQLEELYVAEISESLIRKITDGILDEVKLWQSRPLESVYQVVFFDCMVVIVEIKSNLLYSSGGKSLLA
jgi:putative transposase